MSEEQKKAEETIEEEEDGGINLFDYLIVLAKRKKLILSITLAVAVISFILTLYTTTFYQAEISILPPQQQDNSRLTNIVMSEFGLFSGNRGGIQTRQELLVEIIKSRTFIYNIIKKFGLQEYYGAKDLEEAKKVFLENMSIDPDSTDKNQFKFGRSSDSPLTRIYFRHNNPEQAAKIANTIVEELTSFINNLAISEASQRRLFFEVQLKQISEALNKSEEDIKKFQEKTGFLQIESQTAMVIEKIANLQAQITAKEVELEVMKSYSTGNNPDVQRVDETIKILKKELTKIETNESSGKNLSISSSLIPSRGLEYKRKYRDLKFNETLYEIMVKQYEVAKLDEAKDAVIIQVIDKAIPPPEKTSVRIFGRKKALVTTVLAFLLSCIWILAANFYESVTNKTEYNEKIQALKKYLSFKK